jgi:dolichol-phosphate mannosyltransferase
MPTPEMPQRGDPTEDLIEPERGKLIIPGLRSSPPDKALSLVVPTYNEARNIAETVRRIWAVLYAAVGPAFEIIIVDDDSPDRTWEIALALTRAYPQVRVMRRLGEKSLSTAVLRGWQAATGSVLGVIDADLQHPPEILADLWKRICAGADLAVGSRHVEGGGVSDWRLSRRIVSRGAQAIGALLLPSVVGRLSDPMSGLFLVRREAIAGIEMNPLGYKILIEVIARTKPRQIEEVGYVFRERAEGVSKASFHIYLQYLAHLGRLRIHTLPVAQFARFCCVGASGAVVDMTILYLLSDPRMLAWGLTRSKILAAMVAILNNFYWNDVWTFGAVSRRQAGASARLRRLMKFALISLSGLVLNVVLLNIGFNLLHLNRYIANAAAIAIAALWNYYFNAKLGWRTSAPVSS